MGVPASQIPARSAFRVLVSGFPAAARFARELLLPHHIPLWEGDADPLSEATVALIRGEVPAPKGLRGIWIAVEPGMVPRTDSPVSPDCVLRSTSDPQAVDALLESSGSCASVVFCQEGWAAWRSDGAVFGKSRGVSAPWTIARGGEESFGLFAAGLTFAFIEELLAEDLFDKSVRIVDRESLAMRPLHLMASVETGLAALALADEGASGRGEALGKLRAQLRLWRGPESAGWGRGGR